MCQCGLTKIIFLNVRWEKFLKQMRWLGCPQTCLVGVELQRNGQPIFCRPKVSLKVKSLDVLLSVLRLHGRLLGLLITEQVLLSVWVFGRLKFHFVPVDD